MAEVNLLCMDSKCMQEMKGVREYTLRDYCDQCEKKHGSRFMSMAERAHVAMSEIDGEGTDVKD